MLDEYLMTMIRQECANLSNACLFNDKNNVNKDVILASFKRLNGFMEDYKKEN